ncbi:MAG TPA: autotransporter assembly complex family protein [Acetobacteraceae bacterium]|nr:autotransporter assembly complex family protein [Acetobacteraceae bacterium]
MRHAIRLLLPILLVVAAWHVLPADGQEPAPQPGAVPYEVTLRAPGEGGLGDRLREASRLISLSERAPVDAPGLIARAAAEPDLLRRVLESDGFWAGRTEIRIAGEPPTAPGLAGRLAGRAGPVPVEILVEPGTRYTIASVSVRPDRPEAREAIAALGPPEGVRPGDPARAAPVLDAETALVARLRDAGYPLASVADREIVVDHDRRVMEVAWTIAPGPQARFATPDITGETQVNRGLIAGIAGQIEGDLYSPARLERARRDILALGAFDTVRARAAEQLNPAGRLPVSFEVSDRPRRAVGFTLAYETNYGPTGRVYWEHRNIFGNAERLRVEAEVSRLGAGGGAEDAGYRLGATLRRPGLINGRSTGIIEAYAVRERLEAYDRDAIVLSTLIEYPWTDRIALRFGPTFETGQIGRRGDLQPFTLLGLLFGIRYDSTDSLLDPREGIRLQANVIPYANLAESGGFTRVLASASTYFDLSANGGTVLALRGALGSAIGGNGATLPLDKRFYAGGGGSVRGYAYQGIGPKDARGRAEGGRSLAETSVELRQRVTGAFGMAVFLDGGTVGEREVPDFSNLRFGAGVGVRYATGIGPLRADIAVPLNRERGEGGGFGIYVGLGQAF